MFTRRTLLKRSVLSATLPALGARLATAAGATRVAANDRITVGMIGVGTMGRGHLQGLLGQSDVEVVAICDVVRERTESACEMVTSRYAERTKSGNYAGIKSYVDFRKLLDQPGLDAVLIATPDHWHTIPCILAARAGKHIYCEKPLTHDIAEGKRLVDEIARAKVVFQTGSQQRSEFGGHFRRAVEYVWNGRIGKLKTIRIGVGGPPQVCDLPTQEVPEGTHWDLWLGPALERAYNEVLCPKGVHHHFPAWRNYVEFGGGGLADMGAHHFDIAQWAMETDRGGPVEIIPPANAATGSGLKFVYANGVTMIHNEFEGDARADCVFEGADGMILVSRGGISSRPDSILAEPLGENARRVYPSDNHRGNWLDCIRTGKECICPAEIGHRTAAVCHLANIGYRLGRSLKWDAVAERFIGDDEANQQLERPSRPIWKI